MKDTNKISLSSQSLQTAMSYYMSGQIPAAEEMYRKVLLAEPKNVVSLHMLGIIAAESGRYDVAVGFLSQAIRIKKNDPLLFLTLGIALQKWGKLDDAMLKYKKAVSLKPDYIEAFMHMGDILLQQGRLDESELKYKRIIALKPDYAEAHFSLGNVFKEQRKPNEAATQYAAAIALKPDFLSPYINLGRLYQECGRLNEAILSCERALVRWPDNSLLLEELVEIIYLACAWDKMGDYETRLLDMVRQQRKRTSLFTILETSATMEDQLLNARSYSHGHEPPQQALFTHIPGRSGDRIKIGYLSSDFYEHATAYLMAELFERHDRSRFSITAYSYGLPRDNSPMRQRLVKAFDSFVDLRALSDHDAAQKIYDDGMDILIDLKGGLTQGARIGIPAHRPAPVQVNYLGYPGTMGASFIDYIIADRFVIPEDQERFYSEKVVCLPDCYQPNDTHRQIAETAPTREACGLPERGFVFCCFNGSYKITPVVFDIWMRLLQKTPGSVLWLLEINKTVKGNLQQEAERRGVDPERIIIAPKMPLPEHLARHRLADLFLDTLPINAHTTTSDALWAGLPVLTCVGSTFAGRVAGSLLKAAELPELITYSLEDYEALALQLAQNPGQLAAIRQKLERTRLQVPLFDIGKFVKNIEKSYQTMWDIWQAGEGPKSFNVS